MTGFSKNARFTRLSDSPKKETSSRYDFGDRASSEEKITKKTKSNSDESVKLLRKYCDALKGQVGS